MYYMLFLNLIQGYFVPSSITCVNSMEVSYIPIAKARGFTTHWIKPPAYSGCGSMLVHKGTLWYALESGRERTTLTDSRIKLVLSDRLFKSHFVRWG